MDKFAEHAKRAFRLPQQQELENLTVMDVILWKHPIISASVLVCGCIFLSLMLWGWSLTCITLRAYLLLAFVAALYRAFGHFSGKNPQPPKDFSQTMAPAFEALRARLCQFLGVLQQLFQLQNPMQSVAVFLAVLSLQWILGFFSDFTILVIAFIGTMTIPGIYYNQRTRIHQATAKAQQKAAVLYEKAPPWVKQIGSLAGDAKPTGQKKD